MYTISILYVVIFVSCASRSTADRYHPEWRDDAVGNGPQPLPAELTASYWQSEAALAIQQRLVERQRRGRARNVVMFIGDGMSIPTLAAARTLLGQRHNRTGEESRLSFETFPTVGLAKVRSTTRHYYRYCSSLHDIGH